MSAIQTLQEENTQLHALVQHQREELEQVAFLAGALKDPRVMQAIYLYRKGLGVPFGSFSQWCIKGCEVCACWRCCADAEINATPDTERHAMATAARRGRFKLDMVRGMAEQGDQQAIDALDIIKQLDATQ